jgi:hypothetical protein
MSIDLLYFMGKIWYVSRKAITAIGLCLSTTISLLIIIIIMIEIFKFLLNSRFQILRYLYKSVPNIVLLWYNAAQSGEIQPTFRMNISPSYLATKSKPCKKPAWRMQQYSSTLMMEEIYSFSTVVEFHQTTRRYTPEDRIYHSHRCENLKSNFVSFLFRTPRKVLTSEHCIRKPCVK